MSENQPARLICNGNQMLARGAVEAGCQFYAGYPVPATAAIHDALMRELPTRGLAAIGTPDETLAAAYCLGASARGVKAMTATSSAGWIRLIETAQYAAMAELPIVIVVVQQHGPNTQGETHGAQGAVLLAGYSIPGGYPLPVLAPSDPYECHEMATAAFYWAETLRTPVIVLSDWEVASTTQDLDPATLHPYPPASRRLAPVEPVSHSDKPYDFESPEDVPLFRPVGERRKATLTGAVHDKSGAYRPDGEESRQVLRHLERKVAQHQDQLALVRVEGDPNAETLLIGFGTTARAAREAAILARREGRRVAVANVLSLFPVPDQRLQEAAEHVLRVVVVEENATGQYRSIIEPLFPGKPVVGVTSQLRRITPEQILKEVDESEWKVPYV